MNDVSPGLVNTWLIVSLIFFALNIVLFLALTILAFTLMKWMKEMKPKIESISNRVDAIGKNVEELTDHVKNTAESVGGRAKSVATSVDAIAHLAANTLERFSPYVGGALAAMRLLSGFVQMRKTMAPKTLEMTTETTKVKRGKKSAA
jgi:hypothetical protein